MAMENGPGLKMYFLMKMVVFRYHVSLPEGNCLFCGHDALTKEDHFVVSSIL